MSEERRCDTCQWWTVFHAELGTCRGAPPMPASTRGEGRFGVWPLTNNDEWCGAWSPSDDVLSVLFDLARQLRAGDCATVPPRCAACGAEWVDGHAVCLCRGDD